MTTQMPTLVARIAAHLSSIDGMAELTDDELAVYIRMDVMVETNRKNVNRTHGFAVAREVTPNMVAAVRSQMIA